MEPTQEILSLFGVSLESYAVITGFVYLLVELAKGKWPGFFLGGGRTDLLAFIISGGISAKLYWPQWEPMIAATVLCWLLPAGLHKKLKNGGK